MSIAVYALFYYFNLLHNVGMLQFLIDGTFIPKFL